MIQVRHAEGVSIVEVWHGLDEADADLFRHECGSLLIEPCPVLVHFIGCTVAPAAEDAVLRLCRMAEAIHAKLRVVATRSQLSDGMLAALGPLVIPSEAEAIGKLQAAA